MKRIISLILVVALMLSFAACQGNYAQVNLNEPIEIPENGIIEKSVFDEVRSDNAVATFTGTSGGLTYEWTIFGSDIGETRDVNLLVDLQKSENRVKVVLSETQELGFPALLSVNLDEKWSAFSATAYSGDSAVYSVSLTGSKTSILNISVNKIVTEFEVVPDTPDREGSTSSEISSAADEQNDFKENYISNGQSSDDRVYSDGSSKEKDKYETDPVPEGKPLPVEPENQEIDNKKTYTCTFSIECSTIINNFDSLDPDKRELVPSNGVILPPTKVTFYEGESVYDVLQRVCKENNIHMEASWTPVYNSAYIEGINNLYEFDCGALSGWMYAVDGWYPNYGCSRYQLKDGEKVEWRYTCDLGQDVGCDWLAGS